MVPTLEKKMGENTKLNIIINENISNIIGLYLTNLRRSTIYLVSGFDLKEIVQNQNTKVGGNIKDCMKSQTEYTIHICQIMSLQV
jgi:cytochrome c-type biogenesis protein CcmE